MTKFWTNASAAIWWPNFELMQVVPFGDQIWNECMWRDLVTKFRTNSSGAICWPNLQPIQVVPLKSILNYSSWKIYSRYGVNTLGPLCLWQCLYYVPFSFLGFVFFLSCELWSVHFNVCPALHFFSYFYIFFVSFFVLFFLYYFFFILFLSCALSSVHLSVCPALMVHCTAQHTLWY